MDLTPTTYTAPSSLASSPVAPIYDAWHALAGDFLTLGETIRSCPLDLAAASLGVPVWRTAWPDGVKEQVIAWYGQYGGRLYTRAGLAAFVWIFGGNLTTSGAIIDYWETAVLSIEVYNSQGSEGEDEFLDGAVWTATYASGVTVKLCANPGGGGAIKRDVGGGVYGFTLPFVAQTGGPLPNDEFVSLTPDAPGDPAYYVGMPVPVILDTFSYAEIDPAWAPRTTAATPSSPLAYADDVILSYIAEWMPLGYNLTLDSSAAVIGQTRTIRRIIVTIPSGNPTLVPIGTSVNVIPTTGVPRSFELLSLDPTDDSTIFTGVIGARTYDDRNNNAAASVSLVGIDWSIATAVMDDTIPDGILQYGYPDVVTGDAVLTSGRPGWDAVTVTTLAELKIEVYKKNSAPESNELLDGALWTATYASGDTVKFSVRTGGEVPTRRVLGYGFYGFTTTFVAKPGGPLADSEFVSFTPDDPPHPAYYASASVPVILDIIEYGGWTTLPAIPAIPALGTPVPLPPFEGV